MHIAGQATDNKNSLGRNGGFKIYDAMNPLAHRYIKTLNFPRYNRPPPSSFHPSFYNEKNANNSPFQKRNIHKNTTHHNGKNKGNKMRSHSISAWGFAALAMLGVVGHSQHPTLFLFFLFLHPGTP